LTDKHFYDNVHNVSNFQVQLGEKIIRSVSELLATYVIGKTVFNVIQENLVESAHQEMSADNDAEHEAASLRAYSLHSMEAASTGKPIDKLRALNIANDADKNLGVRELGRQTIAEFIKLYEISNRKACAYDITASGVTYMWIEPERIEMIDAVAETYESNHGLSIYSPQTYEDYRKFNWLANGRTRNLKNAIKTGSSLLTIDWSVPGTAFHYDALKALECNNASPSPLNDIE
jgi:hypothetical protein